MDQQNAQAIAHPTLISQEVCPKCHTPVALQDNFCPHCGNVLLRHISIGKQIWIYFVSVVMPPFGLVWTFRYIRSSYSQIRWVGIVAAILTGVSLIVTVWLTMGFVNGVNQQVQQQLSPYQNSGL